MTYHIVLVGLLVIYVIGMVRAVLDWRRAKRHVFEETVRPFDLAAPRHQGWIDTRGQPEAGSDAPYRVAPPAAAAARPTFAVRCVLRLRPGAREGGMALRKWRVVDRRVEQNPFGLRVSTGEVIPVEVLVIDERIAVELQPQGGEDGQLDCVALLPDRERVEIEGVIETSEGGKKLRADRIVVLPPGGGGDATGRASRNALRLTLGLGMLAFAALVITNESSFVLKAICILLTAFIIMLNPRSRIYGVERGRYYNLAGTYINKFPIRFLQKAYGATTSSMTEAPPPERMPCYTTHDIIRLPLDVVVPPRRAAH